MQMRYPACGLVLLVCLLAGPLPADDPPQCGPHGVALAICPFCDPELIERDGFCGGHGVPEALCVVCRPAVIPAFKAEGDWCGGHDLPESQCERCNPGIKRKWQQQRRPDVSPAPPGRDPGRLWCRAHNLYEDECLICHPELKDAAGRVHADELMCHEHGVAERECGICQPQRAVVLRPGESLKVRTASPESIDKAGIRTALPEASATTPMVRFFGQARYNQNRLARITPLASGVVQRVLVDVGQEVRAGDILVEVASSEVAAAKRDYLLAIVDARQKELALAREKQLLASAIAPQQDYQRAESEHERALIARLTARQRLVNLGFTDDEVDRIGATRSSTSLLHVRAPFDGTLVERTAVIGEAVAPGAALFTLADLSTMWIELAIPETEAAAIEAGQSVRATFQGVPGVEFNGRLVWLHSEVDGRTRQIMARAEVRNTLRRLRDGMFGQVRVRIGASADTLRVPREALQRIETRPFVFVRTEADLFDLRRVEVGAGDADTVELLGGIGPAEAVVVEGAFTMKSEFLKSRLGAGCVHD